MTTADLPPLPSAPLGRPLRVVVLTCGDLGIESARALAGVPDVEVMAVVVAPLPRSSSPWKRLRLVHRRHGLPGLLGLPLRKLRARLRRVPAPAADAADAGAVPAVPVVHVDRFESEQGLATLRGLSPDLAFVDGTYILKAPVFTLPRFGSVNLHCGRLPDYRGAPPGFWELLNGEREVGVTVHRVTAHLDAGPILASTSVPLDPAPAGDPMAYVDALWRESLRAEGIRLMCEVAAQVQRGAATPRPQGTTSHPAYRFPEWATVKQLRSRVRDRRRATA